jgi:glyoxylase-like metal-dependent hydrolase (beta-lactamase superfamily II)
MLEDEFTDILRKAMRGTRTTAATLAERTSIAAPAIESWIAGAAAPSDDEARAVATVLRLDPGKLADAAAVRWHPDTALPPDVRHHPNAPHPSNGYVFVHEASKTAALVDPAGASAAYLPAIVNSPYRLQYILITHKHADHCDATADVARAFPQAKIVMHRADSGAIGNLAAAALPIADGDELPFAEGLSIRLIHTPGHTDGSSCFLIRSNLFSGDTLFAGSIGGAFGDTTGYGDILSSIRTRIFTLPDETVVLPGHGPPTTVGEEKAHNPFF